MHDLDRTLGNTHMESGFAGPQLEAADAFEYEDEFADEYAQEGEFDGEEEFEGEFDGEEEFAFEDEVLHEEEVEELAAELLSVSNEYELQKTLGNVISRVGRAAGRFVRSPVGQQLGGVLRTAAKTALPIAGQAIGNAIAPGAGGAIGAQLASAAGSMFGLELEGLSHEDAEFEVAKQFVRMAADAARTATEAPANMQPREIAERAVDAAARKFAPGLTQELVGGGGASGRWVRKGNTLVIYGA